jgi:hypothetical protein
VGWGEGVGKRIKKGEEGSSEQGEDREKVEAEGGCCFQSPGGRRHCLQTWSPGHPAPPLMKSYLCLCSCLPAPLIPSVSTFNGGQGVQNNIASEQEDQEAGDSEENLKGITGRREPHGMTMMHMILGRTEWKGRK